ncbi:unnamed protein product [Prunus brigantina]
MVLLCGGAVGHVDEDVDTIGGGECHGSHIDRCFRDSVETSMCLRGMKHATWSMQLTYLMQRLMYGRRGFVAGCGVIVLSQGIVTRCQEEDNT